VRHPFDDVMHSDLLDALRGVRWPARRPVPGAIPGMHLSRLRGSAPELSEYRLYRQGDDPRRLDWKLLARSDRAYLRLADDHSVLGTMLVIDASASMAFPAASLAKWRTACALAVGLAAVAHAGSDPVGLVVGGGTEARRLPPRSRRGVVGELSRALESVTPTGASPLASVLRALAPRARFAIVSDFLGDAEEVRRAAGEIAAAGGEVHAVHVVAREELEPAPQAVLAEDPEDPALVRPLSPDARGEYQERFAAWRAELASVWRGDALSYAMVVTDESPSRAVRRIVAPQARVEARR
jgi:uncharacterized protein (DUF58 family)